MLPLPPWMPTTLAMAASLALATPLPAPAGADPAPRAPEATVPKDMSSKTVAVGRDQALEAVLPCGLRVRIARDRTLPVAAVILAIETGPEDDPPESPGLTHALAYQLLQGNRELRPGEAAEIVHGGGGVASLAVGHAQVRFESVVPASRLAQTLWIESERLRFPATRESTWKQSLGWAQADPAQPSLLRPDARAAVHRAPGLARDGRRPGDALREMSEAALAVQIRARFDYARATLVVVAPEDPAEVLAMVEPLFDDLPQAARRAAIRLPGARAKGAGPAGAGPAGIPDGASPAADTPPTADEGAAAGVPTPPAGAKSSPPAPATPPAGAKSSPPAPATPPAGAKSSPPAPATPDAGAKSIAPPAGSATPATPGAPEAPVAADEPPPLPLPETVVAGNHRAPLLAWSIPGTPEARSWAEALCRAMGRQRRTADEARGLKVACVVDPDPRRAALLVQVSGTEDLVGAATARLQRLQGGRDQGLLATQATVLAAELRIARSRPLELARQLAAAAEAAGTGAPQARDLDSVTGVAALADPAELPRVFPAIVDCGGAVLLVRPEAAKP